MNESGEFLEDRPCQCQTNRTLQAAHLLFCSPTGLEPVPFRFTDDLSGYSR